MTTATGTSVISRLPTHLLVEEDFLFNLKWGKKTVRKKKLLRKSSWQQAKHARLYIILTSFWVVKQNLFKLCVLSKRRTEFLRPHCPTGKYWIKAERERERETSDRDRETEIQTETERQRYRQTESACFRQADSYQTDRVAVTPELNISTVDKVNSKLQD